MAVKQGRLTPTDTATNMGSTFYNDPPVVNEVGDVDRIIHNGTQFVRLAMHRPQAKAAARGSTTSSDSLTDSPHYIDGLFAASASSGIDIIRIDFGLNTTVDTLSLVVWSTELISVTTADWVVATSISGLDSQFNDTSLIAPTTSVVLSSEDPDGNGDQFKYTITVTTPPIGNGLRFWRLKNPNLTSAFNNVTEVQVVLPLNPAIAYFNSGGSFFSSESFGEGSNVLDACWDIPNARFYTIRFNAQTTGSTSINLDDDFSGGEAGTASGTTDFNSSRWTQSAANPQFIRTNEELSYSISSGKGQLETTYSLAND